MSKKNVTFAERDVCQCVSFINASLCHGGVNLSWKWEDDLCR